jgi:hypothetical protein
MIEKLAVNYKPATPEKSCAKCYQSEWLEESLFCHQFDCDTRQDMACGLFIEKPQTDAELMAESYKRMMDNLEEVLK